MFRSKSLVVLVGLVLIQGCTPATQDPGDPTRPGINSNNSAGLKSFASEDELANYLLGQINDSGTRATADSVPMPSAPTDTDALQAGGAADSADGFAPAPPAINGEAESAVGDDAGHSGTTVQEAGVDEADVVKTDGTHLYVISSETLRIVALNPLSVVSETTLSGWGRDIYLNGNTLVAMTEGYTQVPIDIDVLPPIATDGMGMPGVGVGVGMMDGEVIQIADGTDDVAVSDDGVATEDKPADDFAIDPGFEDFAPVYMRPQTSVIIYDVSDRSAPRMVGQYDFDGWQASSRMIDGVLRLVVANYQYYFHDIMPMFMDVDVEFRATRTADFIPNYTYTDAAGNKSQGKMCTYRDLYYPVESDGFGTTTLVTINTADPSTFSAVGLVAEPGLIYSSTDALYVTNTQYDFSGGTRQSTNIYKFDYTASGADATATGSIDGRILNQYSMSEHNGYLRVASTVDRVWTFEGETIRSNNQVYVLAANNGLLEVAGKIEDIAPGEQIQAARFLGDRGYLVTFEQVDPLFTLDMADPTSPKIIGELKVPGFSTFIVPMDQNNILTVGEYIPENNDGTTWEPSGVQLSIFDVSDFANPTLKHNVVLNGSDGAYSEALGNPKAFTWYAEENLLALPISIWEYEPSPDPWTDIIEPLLGDGTEVDGETTVHVDVDITVDENGEAVDVAINGESLVDAAEASEPGGFDGLVVYDVTTDGGFVEKGRISTRFAESYYYWSAFTRGVFVDNMVYAVTDRGVRGAPVDNLSAELAEVFYGPVYDRGPWIEGDVLPGSDADVIDVDADSADAGDSSGSEGVRR